jgi:hypothetical protein
LFVCLCVLFLLNLILWSDSWSLNLFSLLFLTLRSYTALPYSKRPHPGTPLMRPAYQGSNRMRRWIEWDGYWEQVFNLI